MIPFLRKASGSILMRGLLAIVMLAVAMSLGISNFFIRNPAKHPVALVGSGHVSAEEFIDAFERKKQELTKYYKRTMTNQEALSFGFFHRTLSELITKELINQETLHMGIIASDEQVSKALSENPIFRDHTGKFNTEIFNDYLNKSHLSERKYLDQLRQTLGRNMLISSLDNQVLCVPKQFSETIFQFLNQEHDVEMITLKIDDLPDMPTPDETTLKEFYNQHIHHFQAPKTRSFNMLLFSFQGIAENIHVSDEDLMALYQRSDNKIPEKRAVRFIPFQFREDAVKAIEELKSGAFFDDVYTRYTGDAAENAPKPQILELKQIRPEIGSEIFSMKKINDVSEAIFLQGQYLIFVLTDIQPERTLSFDEQKISLLKRYKTDMVREKIYDYTQRAEKMLNSGSKLSDVAEVFSQEGIPGIAITHWDHITRDGKNIDGQTVLDLSSMDTTLLNTVFDTPQYSYSDPQKLTTDDYVIVEVTEVKDSHQRPFTEATSQAARYWQVEQKRKRAFEYVKIIKNGLENFEDAEKLVQNNFANIQVFHKITRENSYKNQELAPIFEKLNHQQPNQIATEIFNDKVQLARIIGSYPIDMKKSKEKINELNKNFIIPSLKRDFLSSYIASLEAYFPVKQNEDFLKTLIHQEDKTHEPSTKSPDL